MDTIYFRNVDNPSQMFYENGPVEGIYDERFNAGLPLLNLVHPKIQAREEQRNHTRFQIKKVAFAIIRSAFSKPICLIDKSMGEIALDVFRLNPIKFGRLDDISMDGLLFTCAGYRISRLRLLFGECVI